MTDHQRGLALIVFASVCLSTLSTVLKIGLTSGADPVQLLAPRMALGATLLWLWVGLTRPHRIRISAPGLRACALAGTTNACVLLLFYLALRRVDAAIAVVVFSIYPAMLLWLLHLRGEAVTRRDVLRLLLAITGIALVANPSSQVDLLGVAYAAGCAGLYSLYMLIVHTRLSGFAASTTTLWITSFLALTVFALLPFSSPTAALGLPGWAVVIWSGLIGTTIARLATIEGIRLVGSGQAALLIPVETVLAIVWAALFLGERVNATQGLGAGLILISVMLATVWRRTRAPAA